MEAKTGSAAIIILLVAAFAMAEVYVHPEGTRYDDPSTGHRCPGNQPCTFVNPIYETTYWYTYTDSSDTFIRNQTAYTVDFDQQQWCTDAYTGQDVTWDPAAGQCCGDDSIVEDDPDAGIASCEQCAIGANAGRRNWDGSIIGNACCGDDALDCGSPADAGRWLCGDLAAGQMHWQDSTTTSGQVWQTTCGPDDIAYLSDGTQWIQCATSSGGGPQTIDGGSVSIWPPLGSGFQAEVWTPLAITLNQDAAALYVDGVLRNQVNISRLSPTDGQLHLGLPPSGSAGLSGRIEELSIYGSTLSPTDITSLASGGTPSGCGCGSPPNIWGDVCYPGTEAYYTFEGRPVDVAQMHSDDRYKPTTQGSVSYGSGVDMSGLPSGQAAAFTTGSDHITIPGAAIPSQGDFTMMLWVYLDTPSVPVNGAWDNNDDNGWFVLDRASATTGTTSLKIYESGGLAHWLFQLRYDDGSWPTWTYLRTGEPLARTWQHVTMVREYGRQLRLYVDRQLVATATDRNVAVTPGTLKLGQHYNRQGFPGRVDNLLILHAAATGTQLGHLTGAGGYARNVCGIADCAPGQTATQCDGSSGLLQHYEFLPGQPAQNGIYCEWDGTWVFRDDFARKLAVSCKNSFVTGMEYPSGRSIGQNTGTYIGDAQPGVTCNWQGTYKMPDASGGNDPSISCDNGQVTNYCPDKGGTYASCSGGDSGFRTAIFGTGLSCPMEGTWTYIDTIGGGNDWAVGCTQGTITGWQALTATSAGHNAAAFPYGSDKSQPAIDGDLAATFYDSASGQQRGIGIGTTHNPGMTGIGDEALAFGPTSAARLPLADLSDLTIALTARPDTTGSHVLLTRQAGDVSVQLRTVNGRWQLYVDDQYDASWDETRFDDGDGTLLPEEVPNPYTFGNTSYLCTEISTGFSIARCCGDGLCTGGLATGQSVLHQGERWFCTEDGTFTTDLDDSRRLCIDARDQSGTSFGYAWTGTRCCGDDSGESYNDPGGNGACLQGQPLLNNQGPRFSTVKAINGSMQRCGPLPLNITRYSGMISPATACTADGGYYCSLVGQWEPGDLSSYSPVPSDWPQNAGADACCAQGTCYDGTSCIQQDTSNPLVSPLNGYLCDNGAWRPAILRKPLLGGTWGYCPRSDQCLVSATGNPADNDDPTSNPACIATGQSYRDAVCANGLWSSRTKAIAQALLSIAPADGYTLYCGTYDETTHYHDYAQNGIVVSALFAGGSINNLCVLSIDGEDPIIGTTLNANLSSGSLDIIFPEFTGCLANGAGFSSCSGQAQDVAWYDSSLRGILVRTGSPFRPDPTRYAPAATLLDSIFLIQAPATLRGLPATAPLMNPDPVTDGLLFDRLYLARHGPRQASATKDSGIILGTYRLSDTATLCSVITTYDAARTTQTSLAGAACATSGGTAYVVVRGGPFDDIDTDAIWTELTGSLRYP